MQIERVLSQKQLSEKDQMCKLVTEANNEINKFQAASKIYNPYMAVFFKADFKEDPLLNLEAISGSLRAPYFIFHN